MKPRLDGITQEIIAPLDPDSDYDLLLFATSLAPGNESVLISRGHFHTSHYRNPSELVQGLGFSTPRPYPIPPQDFIVDGSAQLIHPPGITKIPSSDQDLERILAGLGIDTVALPPSPRTIAIWKNEDGWKLHGILLDSDEPIIRDNRMVISDASLGGNNLSIICSNTSKTRILMAPASPVSVRLDDTLSLSIKVLPAGNVITESRSIGTGPHSLYSEGL